MQTLFLTRNNFFACRRTRAGDLHPLARPSPDNARHQSVAFVSWAGAATLTTSTRLRCAIGLIRFVMQEAGGLGDTRREEGDRAFG